MRKVLSLAVVAAMVLAMAGCGGAAKSEYVGKWNAVKVETGGQTVNVADLGGDKLLLDIKDNGKVIVDTGANKDEAKWSDNDGKLEIYDRKKKVHGEIKKGELYLDFSGMVIIFKKDK